jgi:hypothetical protein
MVHDSRSYSRGKEAQNRQIAIVTDMRKGELRWVHLYMVVFLAEFQGRECLKKN